MRNPFSKARRKAFTVRNEAEKRPVPIFEIGAIAISGHLNERMVPVILADLSKRPDLTELIRVHGHSAAGDLKMQWGETGDASEIRLIIEFVRPVECFAMFDFNIREYGAAIDAIFRQRALYLQKGYSGAKLSHNPDAPKVLCEIPSIGLERHWEKRYFKAIFQSFREQGLSRTNAKAAAAKFMERARGLDQDIARSLNYYR